MNREKKDTHVDAESKKNKKDEQSTQNKVAPKGGDNDSKKQNETKNKETKNKEEQQNETKDAKKSKAEVNHNTEKAGLKFNVNTRREWLKEFLSGEARFKLPEPKPKKDEEKKEGEEKKQEIIISGSQNSLTAIEQVLCSHIANLAWDKITEKTKKTGLFEMNYDKFNDAVVNDKEMNAVFGPILKSYNADNDYFKLLKISKEDEIRVFVENCTNSENTKLSKCGLKFLSFLLNHNRTQLAKCAFIIVKRLGKRTISEKDFNSAVEILFGDQPGFYNKLCKKLDDVSQTVKNSGKKDESDGDASGSDDEGDAKATGKKKDGKKDEPEDDKTPPSKKKGGKKDESDDENDKTPPNKKKGDDATKTSSKKKGGKKDASDDEDN